MHAMMTVTIVRRIKWVGGGPSDHGNIQEIQVRGQLQRSAAKSKGRNKTTRQLQRPPENVTR